ncbi:MAG: PAS domain S-box protein [Candidatus Krumholzibacteriia bacterium]
MKRDKGNRGDQPARADLQRLLRLHQDIARDLGAASDPVAALRSLLMAAAQCDGIEGVGVYQRDLGTGEFRLVAHTGISASFARAVARVAEDSSFGRRVLLGTRLAAAEMRAQFGPAMVDEGMRAAVGVPVRVGGRVVAALTAGTSRAEVPENSCRILESLVAHVGNLLARQRSAEAHQETRLNLQTLFDTVDDLILVVDLEGRLQHHNPAVREKLGYSDRELHGGHIGRFLGKSDLAAARALVPELRDGRAVARHLRFLGRDGRWLPTETKAVLGLWDGREAVFVVARDVSERLAAELELRRLATAIEQAAEGFVVTDRHGIIEYVNPAFERITGYGRDEAVGRTPHMLDSGAHDADFYHHLWHTITRGDIWSGRVTTRCKDSRLIVAEVTVSPVRDDAGMVSHFVAVKRDVTREVALEQSLRESQKLEAVGTLAGGIAHDFNNILYALQGYAQLALDDLPAGHPASRSMQEVLRAARRAGELVKQMLAFGRGSEQERRPQPLQPVVEEALVHIRGSFPATIAVETRIDPRCPPVLADAAQIHQAVVNLCANAIHAMSDHSGRLTIRLDTCHLDAGEAAAWSKLAPGPHVRLRVADTGRGMSDEVMARIFEPYFTTRPQNEGAGLGLAIVHGIVQRHGGAIHAWSRPGEGSEFTVLFPAVAAVQGANPTGQDDDRPREAASCRVLVVDDEEVIVKVAVQALSRLGFAVEGHVSPAAALAAFAAEPDAFDVVITDQTMPGMTGLELSEALLNVRPDVPIIMTTGFSAEAGAECARVAGVRRFLQKPVNTRELAAAIDELAAPAVTWRR